MRRKQATAEIVTTGLVIAEAARGASPQNLEKFLDKIVMQRVAEIFTKREDFILEPWFRTRQVAQEIRKLQTVQERNAKATYFEIYGCISCHTQERPHYSNGICTRCHPLILQRLTAIAREATAEHEQQRYVARDLGKLAEECLETPRSPRPMRALKGKE